MSGSNGEGSAWAASRELQRMHRSMRACWRTLASGARGARVVELRGLLAAVVPSVPERSVFNSVLYDHPDCLRDGLEELARNYEAAGIGAWTVWVPESDRASAELLEAAGHKLDAAPRAMALDLGELEAPGNGLEWAAGGSLDELKRVNDEAYGYSAGTFERAMGTPPDGAWRVYEARLEGRVASVLATTEVEGDCGVWWVATVPEVRGRGLARRLLHVALVDARERGMETSTLQATRMGYPVYARLGYRDLGALHMWERRR